MNPRRPKSMKQAHSQVHALYFPQSKVDMLLDKYKTTSTIYLLDAHLIFYMVINLWQN
jgi:hypothetical protein